MEVDDNLSLDAERLAYILSEPMYRGVCLKDVAEIEGFTVHTFVDALTELRKLGLA